MMKAERATDFTIYDDRIVATYENGVSKRFKCMDEYNMYTQAWELMEVTDITTWDVNCMAGNYSTAEVRRMRLNQGWAQTALRSIMTRIDNIDDVNMLGACTTFDGNMYVLVRTENGIGMRKIATTVNGEFIYNTIYHIEDDVVNEWNICDIESWMDKWDMNDYIAVYAKATHIGHPLSGISVLMTEKKQG